MRVSRVRLRRGESGTSAGRRSRRKGGNRRPENKLNRSDKTASKSDPRANHRRKLASIPTGNGSPSSGPPGRPSGR